MTVASKCLHCPSASWLLRTVRSTIEGSASSGGNSVAYPLQVVGMQQRGERLVLVGIDRAAEDPLERRADVLDASRSGRSRR